jgi:hypothetical protein
VQALIFSRSFTTAVGVRPRPAARRGRQGERERRDGHRRWPPAPRRQVLAWGRCHHPLPTVGTRWHGGVWAGRRRGSRGQPPSGPPAVPRTCVRGRGGSSRDAVAAADAARQRASPAGGGAQPCAIGAAAAGCARPGRAAAPPREGWGRRPVGPARAA